MNFNEWYKTFRNNPAADYSSEVNSGELRIGWNACRKEVLNLIKNTDIAQRNAYLVLLELKQKIKDL